MIGRTDIIIDSPLSREETLCLAASRIASMWQNSIFEDAETGEVYHSYTEVPFDQIRELFGYRDLTAYASWEELGADKTNANTMVHLLCYDANRVTVVVDDEANPDMGTYIAGIRESLKSRTPIKATRS